MGKTHLYTSSEMQSALVTSNLHSDGGSFSRQGMTANLPNGSEQVGSFSSRFLKRSSKASDGVEMALRAWVPYDLHSPDYNMGGVKHMFVFSLLKTSLNLCPCRTRVEAELDEAKFQQTFESFGFTVHRPYKDLTCAEVFKKLDDVMKMNHRNTSCVVFVFLTYGDKDGKVNAADKPFWLKEVTNYVLHSPSLAGKPKLFFNQACKNHNRDKGHRVFNDRRVAVTVPTHSDYLAMTCFEDAKSMRSSQGSLFFKNLCDVLREHHSDCDMMDMVTYYNFKLDATTKNYAPSEKPTMKLQYTLTKSLKF